VRTLKRNSLTIDALIAVAVFAGSLGLLAAGTDLEDGAGEVNALSVLLTAAASLPLVARRVAPLPVFVLTALASTVLYGLAQPAGPPLGPTLALYWVAAAGAESQARSRLTLVLVGALLIVHATAAGLAADRFPGTEILFGVLVWGGVWLAGDRTRLRHERMAELEERALRAEREAEHERRLAAAEERSRIARDLHDSAGHAINVILVHAGLGRIRTEADAESARKAFETIEEVARETVADIDHLVGLLREDPSRSEGQDVVEPPAGLAALEGLVERHRATGLQVTVSIRGDRLPHGIDQGAYRILQEALTNAARHGDGSAEVELSFGQSVLEVTVANPLRRDRRTGEASGGHGVVGMRERAALLGGTLEVSADGGRFRLHALLPLADKRK
jgi:signal transduction histidine kinase